MVCRELYLWYTKRDTTKKASGEERGKEIWQNDANEGYENVYGISKGGKVRGGK